MIFYPEVEVSYLINRSFLNALEIANARQSNIEESIKEGPHIFSVEGRTGTNFEILANLEASNSLASFGHQNLLACDSLERLDHFIHSLLVFQNLTDTDVYHNFGNTRHSHRILDMKF